MFEVTVLHNASYVVMVAVADCNLRQERNWSILISFQCLVCKKTYVSTAAEVQVDLYDLVTKIQCDFDDIIQFFVMFPG